MLLSSFLLFGFSLSKMIATDFMEIPHFEIRRMWGEWTQIAKSKNAFPSLSTDCSLFLLMDAQDERGFEVIYECGDQEVKFWAKQSEEKKNLFTLTPEESGLFDFSSIECQVLETNYQASTTIECSRKIAGLYATTYQWIFTKLLKPGNHTVLRAIDVLTKRTSLDKTDLVFNERILARNFSF